MLVVLGAVFEVLAALVARHPVSCVQVLVEGELVLSQEQAHVAHVPLPAVVLVMVHGQRTHLGEPVRTLGTLIPLTTGTTCSLQNATIVIVR